MEKLIKLEKNQINSVPALGNIGPDVIVLQEILLDLGFVIKIDGIFGPKTAKAISSFQVSNGLPGSGVIGPKTLKLLGLSVVSGSPVTGWQTITRELRGRQDRHLHPTFRVMLEAIIFPNQVIPAEFVNQELQKAYVTVMRAIASMGVSESGRNNFGNAVGQIQGVTGSFTEGGNGDAWCLDYGQCGVAFLEDFFQVESPIIGSAHCMTTLRAALKVPGLVSQNCEEGTIALAQHGSTDSGHAMPVLKVLQNEQMETSEGNTSFSNMRDGSGSGIKTRHQFTNGNLKTKGFVRIYPFNRVPEVQS